MSNTEFQILVVDDDVDIGEFITTTAQTLGFNCIATTNVEEFLAALNPKINLIIMDLIMPNTDGVELLRILGKQQCKSNIVLMSGLDRRILETAENLTNSLGLSVVSILQKPFRLAELEAVLKTNTPKNILTDNIVSAPVTLEQNVESFTKYQLQLAIEREEFVTCYQPQIEIATGKFMGVEALVRWQHPKLGVIAPDAFIAQLESFGLIDQLGWLVIKMALKDIKQFANENGLVPRLSINVSPYSLLDLQFPDKLIAIVENSNLLPENIVLEITESGLFKHLSSALDILARLRMRQFKLSIDDFGTGFAMMQQLQNVPATELKIDKSLVSNMNSREGTYIMVTKIIEMGHALGMEIVAEGVDTAVQLEFLRSNNCDVAQGYLFSKPLSVSDFQQWIKNYEWC